MQKHASQAVGYGTPREQLKQPQCEPFFWVARQVRRTRHQLYQHIDGDYYGFRDEEDGTLLKAEAEAEQQLRKKVLC